MQRPTLARALLLVVLSLGLAAAGWGHRMARAGDAEAMLRFEMARIAYGDISGLCGTAPETTEAGCPACRLIDAPGLPATGQGASGIVARDQSAALPPADADRPAVACHPAWNGRAPPVA